MKENHTVTQETSAQSQEPMQPQESVQLQESAQPQDSVQPQDTAQPQEPNSNGPVQRKKRLKGWLRWGLVVLFSPVWLFLLLTVLLYIPFIQDWVVGMVADRLSEETGKKVCMERLRVSFPLDVKLNKLLILNPQKITDSSLNLTFSGRPDKVHTDTILAVEDCLLDLDLSDLFRLRVGVDAFRLKKARVDTQDLLGALVVSGKLDYLYLDVHDVDLSQHDVNLKYLDLRDADVCIALRDTLLLEDTTSSGPVPWNIRFSDVRLQQSFVAFHTVRDTMSVHADVRNLSLEKGGYDLQHEYIEVSKLAVSANSLAYDMNYEAYAKGLDVNHILLEGFEMDFPTLSYDLKRGRLLTEISYLCATEKCGFEIQELTAHVDLDTTHIQVHDVSLRTPTSQLEGQVDMDWTALTPHNRGRMEARLSADFSKQDILMLAGEVLSPELLVNYPDRMLTAEVSLVGNVDAVQLKEARFAVPEMLDVSLEGTARNLLAGLDSLGADFRCEAQAWDASALQKTLNLNGFTLPPLHLNIDADIHRGTCTADLNLQQEEGTLSLCGNYNMKSDAYDFQMNMNQLVMSRFLPMDSVLCLTAHADLKGQGTDFLSNRCRLQGLVAFDEVQYGNQNAGSVRLDALMQEGQSYVNFSSRNALLNADGCVEARLYNRQVEDATFSLDMRGVDLHTLGLVEKPLSVSMALHLNGHTDLKTNHYLKGFVNALQLQTADTIYYPRDIETELLMQPDSLFAFLSAGDLRLNLNSPHGLEHIQKKGQAFYDQLLEQMQRKVYDQHYLTSLLPEVDLCVASGRQNPLAAIVSMMGYTYREFDVDLHTSPVDGLNGQGWVHTFNTGAIVLDTLQFRVQQDSIGMQLDSRVCNGRCNPDITFDARLKTYFSPRSTTCSLLYFDEDGRKGVDLGAELLFQEGMQRLRITPSHPILAYRYFTVNDSNYVSIDPSGHIEADLDLLADDGTGIKVFSTPNDEADQDLTISMNRFNLGELCSVLPYMPSIRGFLQGDVHLLQTMGIPSVSADLLVKLLNFEGSPMGDVGVNVVYMPNEDGSHFVDGFFTQNKQDVLSFNGTYKNLEKGDHVDATAQLHRFPLPLANAFLGDLIQLEGNLTGAVSVFGSTGKPQVDGELRTDGVHVLSPNYSVDFRIPDESLPVQDNRINLSKLRAYGKGKNPLMLDGYVDIKDLSNLRADLTVRANDFELVNAPRNRKAEVYGKLFVNLDMQVRGPFSDLAVTGDLDVLGNSDFTYVLKDSPITIDDEMADLVTFVDFGDTIAVAQPQVTPPSNLRLRLGINIDQAVQLHCLLSEDGANFANIEGGGNLVLSYDALRGLQLNGRYTILNGRMNYTLMVVSLRDCDIQNGSYVEFNGDVLNPRLNISASERLNTTITENQTPRSVAFDVGLKVSKTLSDMGLEFTLQAPEDMNIQNELAQMTPEQRGRVAVTMMATGMYVVEGKSSGGYNTTNALNSFLNSQISQITGKALNTVDLSLGVQNTNTASGNITTDYSFRFAKRFWGNRISLIVGGKVSGGAEAENSGQSIIDNVSIEYRLDKSATRCVNVYYDNNYESVLEGRVTEMGAGIVLRRKTTRLGELFLFRNRREKETQTEALPAGNREKKRKGDKK